MYKAENGQAELSMKNLKRAIPGISRIANDLATHLRNLAIDNWRQKIYAPVAATVGSSSKTFANERADIL